MWWLSLVGRVRECGAIKNKASNFLNSSREIIFFLDPHRYLADMEDSLAVIWMMKVCTLQLKWCGNCWTLRCPNIYTTYTVQHIYNIYIIQHKHNIYNIYTTYTLYNINTTLQHIQDRELMFSVRFLCPGSSKHDFIAPLKNVLFWTIAPIKILV